MRKGLDRVHKAQEGVILIEFTLTASILLVIFLATITFSLLFTDYYRVHKVAREGAKEASITHDTALAGQKAKRAAALWGLNPDKIQVYFSTDSNSVECTVTYTAVPLNKTFPKLLDKENLKEVRFRSKAIYAWFDG